MIEQHHFNKYRPESSNLIFFQVVFVLIIAAFCAKANAAILTCQDSNGSYQRYDTSGSDLTIQSDPDTSLGTLINIVDKNQVPVVKLQLTGHALNPSLNQIDENGQLRPCTATGDLQPLFTAQISNPQTKKGIAAWEAWKASRPSSQVACAPEMDSLGYFQASATKVAVVIHGVGGSPSSLNKLIRILLDNGYNVLAPRLSRHFSKNPKALDRADYREWIGDSEAVFLAAKKFNSSVNGQVTLGGFSLGGLLVSRLALRYADNVDRLLLFAPAWRLNPTSSGASGIGSLLNWAGMKLSYNEIMNVPIACRPDQGYLPPNVGSQIETLISSVGNDYGISNKPTIPVEFNFIIPNMVVISDATSDNAIDTESIGAQCDNRRIVCTRVQLHGVSHTALMSDLTVLGQVGSTTKPVDQAVKDFLDMSN